MLVACNGNAEKSGGETGETPNVQVKPTNEEPPKDPVNEVPPSNANENGNDVKTFKIGNPEFEAVVENYTAITLPREFPSVDGETVKELLKKPISQDDLKFICTEMMKCTPDEQAFYGFQFPVSDEAIALVSYIQGDFQERFMLSTHDEGGQMIAALPIAGVWEDLNYGYASDVQQNLIVFRSKMISRYDEGAKKQVQDVDSEDKFQIAPTGEIIKQ